ncbi:ArsA-related P-loop ATPase [Kitasatospora sp. NPDC048540]|uniref:ArsA family ATPase n=1 Tax=unclassified Kitasatospora TaxID=2633591 RepID=UPI00053B0339|nr:ArsA-related P-loop ATPase [Kitasatospora sp. MBT63]
MVPRTILVSGAGEAAVTVAAATALHHAAAGRRTLLLAADDPHRALDALLGTRVTGEPARYADRLDVARIDEQAAFRDTLAALEGRLAPALTLLGAEPLDPDELTPLPGTRQLALLRALRPAAAGDAAEVVVVAGPAPAELIATLAMPEQLDRYLTRLLPEQRQAARALRPLLAAVAGVPMPADWLFEAGATARTALAEAREVIAAPTTTVRLAVDADTQRPAELRRIRAGLALYGHRLDAVAAHRALPAGATSSPDAWLAAHAAHEAERLAELAAGLDDVPLLVARRPEVALEDIAAQLYAAGEPQPGPDARPRVEDRLAEDGLLLWHLPLPGADRSELELVRRGDELVLGVGGYRRILLLPSALRRCTVSGAGLADGVLTLRFAPDPALWPRATGE